MFLCNSTTRPIFSGVGKQTFDTIRAYQCTFYSQENLMFSGNLIKKLKSAKSVAVLTGAGISAESGVPVFRGEEGLWNKFRPEELANLDSFMKNPKLVWEWYSFRKKLIKDVRPNPGHYALVKLEQYFPDFTLITQNIDNLHCIAGSKNICELHGNIMHNRCVDCSRSFSDIEIDFGKDEIKLPQCTCGGLIRPDVVWFGEPLPEKEINLAFNAAINCDLFLAIGTSAVVQPAASLPLEAKQANAYVIEINCTSTIISQFIDECILGKSGEVLPKLIKSLGIE